MSTRRNDYPLPEQKTVTPPLGGPPPPVILPDIDARTYALNALAKWLCSLQYRRTMEKGAPSDPFALDLNRVFIEYPDNIETVQFPSIAIVPGRGQYIMRSDLGPADVDESSKGRDSPGNAFIIPCDYKEPFALEIWGSKISERRSMVAAIETMIFSYEGSSDLRLVMDDYYGLVATFTLLERENIEDLETPRGRRRAHLYMELQVPVVRIGYFELLKLQVDLNIGASTTLSAVNLEAATNLTGEAGLNALGLSVELMRDVAKSTLNLSQNQANALTADYLLALAKNLIKQESSMENYKGRPPYSPSENLVDSLGLTGKK